MPALINPGTFDQEAAGRDLYMVVGLTVLLFIMSWHLFGKRKITRVEGGILFGLFIAYQFLLFS